MKTLNSSLGAHVILLDLSCGESFIPIGDGAVLCFPNVFVSRTEGRCRVSIKNAIVLACVWSNFISRAYIDICGTDASPHLKGDICGQIQNYGPPKLRYSHYVGRLAPLILALRNV